MSLAQIIDDELVLINSGLAVAVSGLAVKHQEMVNQRSTHMTTITTLTHEIQSLTKAVAEQTQQKIILDDIKEKAQNA
jgi:hypothetical protein